MILYHGTAAAFSAFDPGRIGRGGEANSALGIWATRCPHIAADYAASRTLLILEITAPRLAITRDRTAALRGGADLPPDPHVIGRLRFARAREVLSREGYDGVWCEMQGTDLEGAVCVFHPGRLRIFRSIELSPRTDLLDLEDPCDDSHVDIDRSLEDLLLPS